MHDHEISMVPGSYLSMGGMLLTRLNGTVLRARALAKAGAEAELTVPGA